MHAKLHSFSPARLVPIAVFFCIGFVILNLSRLGLSLWQHAQISAVHGWSTVFLQGMRVDIASLCLLFVPIALFALLWPATWLKSKPIRWFIALWIATATSVLVTLEMATPDFISEFGLRPNRQFVEYLIYPREVFLTLIKGRPLQLLLGVALSVITWFVSLRFALRLQDKYGTAPQSFVFRLIIFTVVLLAGALGVRSTLGHRPMNPAMIAFSSNPTVNVLPLNSFYSLAHAMRDWLRHEEGAPQLYGDLPTEQVITEIRAGMNLPAQAFTDPALPTLAARQPTWTGKPRNLVIILEESLGAQFIGSLGGRPLSPNYDRLSEQGWTFTRAYATGTRSVRGIEAVTAGFMPTPAQAVVKRPRSQQDFFTLAQVLRPHGYDATFYYGGESHFDNMRGFFLSNGFNRVIEQKDYVNPTFEGSWGVSDEDLFLRADQEFRQLHAAGKPFFGFIFSSSNHEPFEYPENRIEPFEQPRQTRNNAAKYADYALGVFFEQAMHSPYWNDTVFLVIADHDSRVVGRDLVPIDNFHIPALILGPSITARKDSRIVSQVDLPVTLLSLIGIADPTPMIGRDLSNPNLQLPGRAFMQYDRNFAYMQDDEVVIFQPDKPASQYHYAGTGLDLSARDLNSTLAKTAHAHALWGTLAYENDWHRLKAK